MRLASRCLPEPMSARPAIFLDANAGLPLPQEIQHALIECFARPLGGASSLANPSSIHLAGRNTRREVELARSKVATSLGLPVTQAQTLHFTSSGTAANATVIASALGIAHSSGLKAKKRRWVVTSAEHASVRDWIPIAQAQGIEVELIPVDSDGRVDLEAWTEALERPADLATVLWVNNESGVIQDLAPLVLAARKSQTPVHVDAAQAWGKLPIRLPELGATYLTLSGHKLGALTGIGMIYAQSGSSLMGLIPGSQEHGKFGGTENVLGAISMGFASERVTSQLEAQSSLAESRDQLQARITQSISGVRVHGVRSPRVSNTLHLGFEGLTRPGLVAALDLEGIQVSAGAACSSGTEQPSAVLLAMGASEAEASSSIRISLPRPLSAPESTAVVEALERSLARMRRSEVNVVSRKEQSSTDGQFESTRLK